MEFGLSEDQVMLQETVRRFVAEEASLDTIRAIADQESDVQNVLDEKIAALGLDGLLIPEEVGGSGLGVLDAILVQECFGYGLVPSRFLSNTIAAYALGESGSELAGNIASGAAKFGVALNDIVSRRDASGLQVSDTSVTGKSLMAINVRDATHLLFYSDDAIHCGAPDETSVVKTIDRTREFFEVAVAGADPDAKTADVEQVFAVASVLIASDTLGAAQAMLDKAVVYASEREQFGRVIGSFQAVKHLCAEMAAKLEPCRALLWHAAHAIDENDDEAITMAYLAKAHMSDVATFIARTSTEVHGGMGFTDLVGLHYWFKRIGVNRQLFGTPMVLRERAARQQGLVA